MLTEMKPIVEEALRGNNTRKFRETFKAYMIIVFYPFSDGKAAALGYN